MPSTFRPGPKACKLARYHPACHESGVVVIMATPIQPDATVFTATGTSLTKLTSQAAAKEEIYLPGGGGALQCQYIRSGGDRRVRYRQGSYRAR